MALNSHVRSMRPLLRVVIRSFGLVVIGTATLVACAGSEEGATETSATDPPGSVEASATSEVADPPTTDAMIQPSSTAAELAAEADGTEICPAGEYPAFGAFELSSGDLQWSTCSPDEAYRSLVGASDAVVLVLQFEGDGSADTIALDAATGVELWRRSTVQGLGVPPGPVVGLGVAVVETDAEGTPFVMGVDASTGTERWRLGPGESVVGLSDEVVVLAPAPPTGLPDPLAPPRGLRGVDRASGQEVWTSLVYWRDDSGVGVARGAAALSDGTITVPTGSSVNALDVATGEVLWTAPRIDHPAAADGAVLGTEPSSGPQPAIRSLDATTGDTLWSAPGRASYGDLLAVGDGVGVVIEPTTSAELIAYDLLTGAERWRIDRTAPGEPQLTVDQSVVLLWEAHLGTISTVDGSTIWSLTMPLNSPLMNSVAANVSTVFVAVNSLPWGD